MNSLITDSYLLSITRNPHISRVASRCAFAFLPPPGFIHAPLVAQTYSIGRSPAPFSMLRIRSTHISAGCTTPATCVVATGLYPDPRHNSPFPSSRDSVRHANASDWIFEGAAAKEESRLVFGTLTRDPGTLRPILPRNNDPARAPERSILNAQESL